jgi:hypothetical protein
LEYKDCGDVKNRIFKSVEDCVSGNMIVS